MCTQKQYQKETGKVVNQYLPKPSTLPPTPDPKIHSQVVPDFLHSLPGSQRVFLYESQIIEFPSHQILLASCHTLNKFEVL